MSIPTELPGHEHPVFPPSPPESPGPRRPSGLLAGVIACLGVIALTVVLIASGAFGARTTTTVIRSSAATVPGLNAASIYAKANPGVVDITSKSVTTTAPQSPLGLPGTTAQTDTGTGMVIDPQGHILTADHVVAGAKSVTVTVPGGVSRKATVVAGDAATDVAVLKIDPAGLALHPVTLGTLTDHRVGDPVAVVGDPFDVQRSLSTGVISGLDRTISGLNGYSIPNALQTDAAMNPGNSGGPVLDASGRVIGIADQIATGGSGADSSTGVGFAVPIEIVKAELTQLEAGNVPAHANLGIAAADATGANGVSEVLVGQVRDGGAAAQAGVKTGDAITAIGATKVDSVDSLIAATAALKPGGQTTVTVLRHGQTKTLNITPGKQPTKVTGS
jgi:S1-C subfamily serine protease